MWAVYRSRDLGTVMFGAEKTELLGRPSWVVGLGPPGRLNSK